MPRHGVEKVKQEDRASPSCLDHMKHPVALEFHSILPCISTRVWPEALDLECDEPVSAAASFHRQAPASRQNGGPHVETNPQMCSSFRVRCRR